MVLNVFRLLNRLQPGAIVGRISDVRSTTSKDVVKRERFLSAKVMKMKRKHLGFGSCLVIFSCSLPAQLCAIDRSEPRAAIGPQVPVAGASWQEDAMHAMSQRLCGAPGKAKAPIASREQMCVSLLTELIAKSGESQNYTLPAPENVSWSSPGGSDDVTFDTDSPEVVDDATVDQMDFSDVGASVAGQQAMSSESGENPGNQGVDGAIPGSLLVTILALIGIVAVARRDVAGKPNSNPVVQSGTEVARISSLRDDVKVDAVHRRLN